MKRRIIYLLAVIGMLSAGCNETDDGDHVDAITLYEKVGGSWSLSSLKMVDEFAKANALEPHEENLSSQFNYADFKINLNVDEKMKPTSYEVTGNVPPLFAPTGFWALSTDFQPTNSGSVMVLLYSDAAKTQLTDSLRLTSVPGSNEEMEFQLVRTSGGTPFISYVFKLTAIN
ncbi:DUF5004 domain-containing protein [Flavobacterium sp. 3HN19-14]|uniref:DUF5004 domain-containing protein n=1 Tax=Flavobacterium sp. 3HN19-14 TaxID=3448133 RepID=UPI003EE16984